MFRPRCQICGDYWVREGRPMRDYVIVYGGGHIPGAHDLTIPSSPAALPDDNPAERRSQEAEAEAVEQQRRREAEAVARRSPQTEAEIAGLKGEVGRLNSEVAYNRGELDKVKAALRASQQEFAAMSAGLDSSWDEIKRLAAWVAELERRPTVSMGGERHVEHGFGQIGMINLEGSEFKID